MDQIIIGDKASFDDFGASVASRSIEPPKKKSIKETVPFSNVTYDFSKINGELYWEERVLEYVFEMTETDPERLTETKTAFSNWIMQVMQEELHDPIDPDYHYVVTYNNMNIDDDEGLEKSTITVTFTAYPFKISNVPKVYDCKVKGQGLLEFNGDLTGREYVPFDENAFSVKVTDKVLTETELVGSTICMCADGQIREFTVTADMVQNAGPLVGLISEGVPLVVSVNEPMEGFSTGTYFIYTFLYEDAPGGAYFEEAYVQSISCLFNEISTVVVINNESSHRVVPTIAVRHATSTLTIYRIKNGNRVTIIPSGVPITEGTHKIDALTFERGINTFLLVESNESSLDFSVSFYEEVF